MPDLRAVIVDDEPLALDLLRSCLANIDGVTVVGEAGNGIAAVDIIQELDPDVAFLDIEMPGFDGFEVVKQLQSDTMPMIVFVTAYNQYAIDAFDVHAVDYVLKPIDPGRLERAVARSVERRLLDSVGRAANKGSLIDAIESILTRGDESEGDSDVSDEPGSGSSDILVIRDSGAIHRIDKKLIDWVDAAGDYMCIHAGGETVVTRMTMKKLLEALENEGFARIHRSTIVNLSRVDHAKALTKGDYELHLAQGVTLKLSRNFRKDVMDRLE